MSKRNEYLSKRDLHREYLGSPAWAVFRKKALAYYGAICARCGEYGNDVDHKTYKNWGEEKIEDVQILCRLCHEVKHVIERAGIKKKNKSSRKKLIHKKALWGYLSRQHKRKLMDHFGIQSEFELGRKILNTEKKNEVIRFAAKLMGVEVYGIKGKCNGTKPSKRAIRKAEELRKWRNKYK